MPGLKALARHVCSVADTRPTPGERLPQWLNDVRADDLLGLHNFVAGPSETWLRSPQD
jgi:hypothetical protein